MVLFLSPIRQLRKLRTSSVFALLFQQLIIHHSCHFVIINYPSNWTFLGPIETLELNKSSIEDPFPYICTWFLTD